jgi:hypothetical protein
MTSETSKTPKKAHRPKGRERIDGNGLLIDRASEDMQGISRNLFLSLVDSRNKGENRTSEMRRRRPGGEGIDRSYVANGDQSSDGDKHEIQISKTEGNPKKSEIRKKSKAQKPNWTRKESLLHRFGFRTSGFLRDSDFLPSLLTELVGDHEDAAGEERQRTDHGAGIDFRSGASAGDASGLGMSDGGSSGENQGKACELDSFANHGRTHFLSNNRQ